MRRSYSASIAKVDITVFGDVERVIKLELVGGQTLQREHAGPPVFVVIFAPLVGVLNADLKVPERRDQAGIEQVGFRFPLIRTVEDRLALVLPPELIEVAADPALSLPSEVIGRLVAGRDAILQLLEQREGVELVIG